LIATMPEHQGPVNRSQDATAQLVAVTCIYSK
jgi:hypothetical protein